MLDFYEESNVDINPSANPTVVPKALVKENDRLNIAEIQMELYALETAHYLDNELVELQVKETLQQEMQSENLPNIPYNSSEEDPDTDYDVEAVNWSLQERLQDPEEAQRIKARLFEGIRPEVLQYDRQVIGDFVSLMKRW